MRRKTYVYVMSSKTLKVIAIRVMGHLHMIDLAQVRRLRKAWPVSLPEMPGISFFGNHPFTIASRVKVE